jgi:hypothetical protein
MWLALKDIRELLAALPSSILEWVSEVNETGVKSGGRLPNLPEGLDYSSTSSPNPPRHTMRARRYQPDTIS